MARLRGVLVGTRRRLGRVSSSAPASELAARPPRLVLRFALYTAVGLVLAAVAILWFLRQDATERAQEEVAARARSLAYTTLPDALVPADFQRPVTGSRRDALDALYVEKVFVEGAGVLRLTLVRPDGTITYSNQHDLIGTRASGSAKLEQALRGRTVLEGTRLGEDGPRALVADVPIRLSGGLKASGVVRIYADYGRVAREVEGAVKQVAIVLGAVLLALYAALFPVLHQVTRRLASRTRAEAERGALVAQNERLRELDRQKDDFVWSVSHELRTPLTSIRGYLDIVLEDGAGELTTEQRRFLQVVDRNADRLLRLVGELLLVAELDAGNLGLVLTDVDLESLAAESVEAARPLAAEKRIALDLEVAQVPPVVGDASHLARLLDNLVSNGIKFTPEDGRVSVRVRAEGDSAHLDVSDTGMGIPHDQQGHVFERFFRASGATAQAIPGTGLGLAIAKAIVEAHGGSISVESRVNEGTTFHVELPLPLEAASESSLAEQPVGVRKE
jgi:signal transduction histidine kinase